MKTIKRILVGLAYAIPFLGVHALIAYLYYTDAGTVVVLKKVGYVALGIYSSLFLLVCIAGVGAMTLLAIKFLFKIKIKTEMN